MLTPNKSFVKLASGTVLSYNDEAKRQFASQGKKVLKAIAESMGLAKGTYDIRWNPGGIAVSGDIVLHGESIYVDLSQTFAGPDCGFMYRSCKGRKDYTGGVNHWANWDQLLDLDKFAKKLVEVSKSGT